ATAIALMERALALDPEFPMLVAFAAWAHEKRDTLGLPPLHADPRRGLSLARLGIRISADDPQALVICSTMIMMMVLQMTSACGSSAEILIPWRARDSPRRGSAWSGGRPSVSRFSCAQAAKATSMGNSGSRASARSINAIAVAKP